MQTTQEVTSRPHLAPLDEHERLTSITEVVAEATRLEDEFRTHSRAVYNGPNGEFEDTEPDERPFEIVATEVVAEMGEKAANTSISDTYLAIRSRLQGRLAPETFAALVPHIDSAIQAENELKKLEERYGDTVRAHRDAKLQQAITHADWDRVVDVFVADKWPDGASVDRDEANRLMHLLNERMYRDTITDAAKEAECYDRLMEFAKSVGGLREQPLAEPERGWLVHGDLHGAMDNWIKDTGRLIEYMSGHRAGSASTALRHTQSALAPFEEITRRWRLSSYGDRPAPAPLVEACERRIAVILQQFTTRDKEILSQEVGRRPNLTHIGRENRDILEKTAGITDIPAWVQQRLARFGHRLSYGIGFIAFTDGDETHLAVDQNDDRATVTAGQRIIGENTLHIDVRKGTREYFLSGNQPLSEASATRIIREEVNETFDHEVGHHIHGAMLTVEELRLWDEALEAEPDTKIDYYIQSLVDKGAADRRLRVEQFATSIAIYMNDPLRLAVDYPRRYAALNSIVGRYGSALDNTVQQVADVRRTSDITTYEAYYESMRDFTKATYK